jgi:dipeptidyl aminopeptidase/acylaminoacyl peptidase
MMRWCTRFANKPFVFLATVAVTASLATSPLPISHSKEVLPAAKPTRPLILPEVPLYTVHAGQVTATGQNAASVDTIDIVAAYARAAQLGGQAKGKIFKATITPHWFDNGTRFWYRNDTRGNTTDFVLVDAEKGTRLPAFDHDKLAASLSKATGAQYQGNKLPFQTIEFANDAKLVRFGVNGAFWQCDLASYECTKSTTGPKDDPAETPADLRNPADEEQDHIREVEDDDWSPDPYQKKKNDQKKGGKQPDGTPREVKSPDGKWTAFIKEFSLWMRDADGKETKLTENGVEGNAFGNLVWSTDSKVVVAYRTEPGDNKTVYLLESSPTDQLPARLNERPYPRPGDKLALHEMYVVDVDAMKATKVDTDRIDQHNGMPRLRWSKDRKTFTFELVDRGHQRFRIVEVTARTGATRNLVDEKTESFHWTIHAPRTGLLGIAATYLDTSKEILLVSQRDGWKHMYLIDAATGEVKNQITKGHWVVRGIEKIDEGKRQIWFLGSGKNPDQDPYLLHYYRVNFDGTGLVALTDGNGDHQRADPKGGKGGGKGGTSAFFQSFSPDGKYYIDRYSRVDMAPVHELRRVSDGTKVCDLEKADVSALEAAGWRYPEVFAAKGRDGTTDIWGIVYRPQNFDANKKYPVIEYIYAGPHDSHVPKTFAATRAMAALAELGFIVVQIDGMGTANRSRAFHDVCWKNLADAGFPDRILWIKALAKKYAYVDISRVGIYGTSAGGQNACGAVLFHPEFYKVAVAACGCHDNRLDKRSWNEQWMGLMGPHYEKQSNFTNAKKLQGRLLLIVGEMDTNVPPESTYRVVDALIKAKKDFDLIVVPGMNHSSGGPHGERRKNDFFVQHLLGVQPPNHNAIGGKVGAE